MNRPARPTLAERATPGLDADDVDVLRERTRAAERVQLAEAALRHGHWLVVGGFAIAIAGVAIYCIACLRDGGSAGLDDLLLRGTVPMARVSFAAIVMGTMMWLAGAITYFNGTIVTDGKAGDERTPPT